MIMIMIIIEARSLHAPAATEVARARQQRRRGPSRSTDAIETSRRSARPKGLRIRPHSSRAANSSPVKDIGTCAKFLSAV